MTIKPLRVADQPDPLRPVRVEHGTVLSIAEVGPAVFDLVVATGSPVPFRPGQFAIVHGPQDQRRC
ncbi:hypothetical protein [Longivirga aurantiaca]|uniref:FAD-binding FR-type domain-containing protein n=1 Tax=Longivirga aurantiaca TaxID=1837743 RepID=A0ABW1T0D4_9ACTN